MKPRKAGTHQRRGVAAVTFVTALLVMATFTLWVAETGAGSARTSLGHLYSENAFYAAESGMEYAMFELNSGADLDGDGTMGSISNDSNNANDPGLGTGTFHVTYSSNTLTSTSTWQSHSRVLEATLQ